MATQARNVAILLALAAVLMFAPGGGSAGSAILESLVIAMLASLAWFAVRLYREHRTDLYALGDRNRTLLYAAVGLATLTVTATDRLWATGPGTLVWFALIGVAGWTVYVVFRASRQY
jgi:hypothetical protein